MRILHHTEVGAVFIDRFPKSAPVLQKRSKGGFSKTNWRCWYVGRWRFMVVKATQHWATR
jgi:hypothetical protein